MHSLENNLEQFEAYLFENLPQSRSFHPHYEKALSQMLIAGGKRFRPMLLLKVVEILSPLLLKNAYPVAFGVEMLHTYSLIHDDLPSMDNSPLRRGHQTLHVAYDEVSAILVGDALNTEAFYRISKAPLSSDIRIKLVEELANNGGMNGMVLGQAIDCHFENFPLKLEELEFLHLNKTAKLIACSLKMGAIIAESDLADKLYLFGLKLGVLFQVEDDIIDATQSSSEAGKPTQNDGVKNSFTNLLGVEGAQSVKKKMLDELLQECEDFGEELSDALGQIIKNYFKK